MKKKLPESPFWSAGELGNHIHQFILMTDEQFTIKDIGVSYTELNYWDKKGLLPQKREHEAQWRKFNFFDIVWLNMIREMRKFGVKTELIQLYKEELFSNLPAEVLQEMVNEIEKTDLNGPDESLGSTIQEGLKLAKSGKVRQDDTLSFFQFNLFSAMTNRISASFLFFDSGSVCLWIDENEMDNPIETRLLRAQNSHLSIPISNMVGQLIEENLIVPYLPELGIISDEEAELLEMINEGKYKSITITFKNNKPDMIITKKSTPADKRSITDAILEGSYQSLKLEVHNGKVTMVENDKKIQYSKLGKDK